MLLSLLRFDVTGRNSFGLLELAWVHAPTILRAGLARYMACKLTPSFPTRASTVDSGIHALPPGAGVSLGHHHLGVWVRGQDFLQLRADAPKEKSPRQKTNNKTGKPNTKRKSKGQQQQKHRKNNGRPEGRKRPQLLEDDWVFHLPSSNRENGCVANTSDAKRPELAAPESRNWSKTLWQQGSQATEITTHEKPTTCELDVAAESCLVKVRHRPIDSRRVAGQDFVEGKAAPLKPVQPELRIRVDERDVVWRGHEKLTPHLERHTIKKRKRVYIRERIHRGKPCRS